MRKLASVVTLVFSTLALAASACALPAASDGSLIGIFHWRNIAAAQLGTRVNDVAVPVLFQDGKNRTGRIIYGSSPGGVYKSVNYGVTWQQVFNGQPSVAVGTVTVDPNDPDTVWAGTGDFLLTWGREVPGTGIYKSTDAGRTWHRSGLAECLYIAKIVVDPSNSRVVYAAALGSRSRPSEDRGLYKTTDGGKTWKRIAFINGWTGAVDIALNPQNTNIIYVAMWQSGEDNNTFTTYGPGSRILRSTDGGNTWSQLTSGLPGKDLGRIGVAVSASHPHRVYALIDEQDRIMKYVGPFTMKRVPYRGFTVLYRSDDGGDTWTEEHSALSYGSEYYQTIEVDPQRSDTVYSVNAGFGVSTDAGRSFRFIGVELDNHAVWIDPSDSQHLIVNGDSGIAETRDGRKTWSRFHLPGGGLYYYVATGWEQPFYTIYGTLQDYGVYAVPSGTRAATGIGYSDWTPTLGDERSPLATDRFEPGRLYNDALSQVGVYATRYDGTTRSQDVIDTPDRLLDMDREDDPEIEDVLFATGNRKGLLYAGTSRVYASNDGGRSWKTISPDLRAPLSPVVSVMGLQRARHAFEHDHITTIAASATTPEVLWAGLRYGSIYVTTNDGGRWSRADVPRSLVPPGSVVTKIIASRQGACAAYVTLDAAASQGDPSPYIFRTSNCGKSWRKVVPGLPDDATAWSIAEDPARSSLLFAGTERGVFYSQDRGEHWFSLRNDMPAVRVNDLTVQPQQHDLVAASWGRGIYVLDDITPLETVPNTFSSPRSLIFPIRTTIRVLMQDLDMTYSFPEDHIVPSSNPPYGVPITYYIAPLQHAQRCTVAMRNDDLADSIADFRVDDRPGFHRALWKLTNVQRFSSKKQLAILVPPGMYQAQLHCDKEKTPLVRFTVTADPGIPASYTTYQLQYAMLMNIAGLEKRAFALLARTKGYQKLLLDAPTTSLDWMDSEGDHGIIPQLDNLAGAVQASLQAPTPTERAVLADIEARLDTLSKKTR